LRLLLSHPFNLHFCLDHDIGMYTWFTGESMDCEWHEGCCPEWSLRNSEIIASVAPARAAVEQAPRSDAVDDAKPRGARVLELAAAAACACVAASLVIRFFMKRKSL
jgi:hypothetical protein